MKLQSPNDVLQALKKQYERHHRIWLTGIGQWPLSYKLCSLTEKEVASNIGTIRHWVTAWENNPLGGTLTWETRQWPRLGTQRLPRQIFFDTPFDVAALVGQTQRWNTAVKRYTEMCGTWPLLQEGPALPRYFDELADYSTSDFNRLLSLLTWLVANPDSNRYVRQLPIEGLDTKWIGGGSRKGLVTDLVRAIRGLTDDVDFHEACGIRKPAHRLRIRVLCPQLRARIGGLTDIEAPLQEIASLAVSPRAALIVENLETGLALPDLPGVVAFMKLGNAISVLANIPWLKEVDVLYWGDIDTYGFAILARARKTLPQVRSILMDEITLQRYRPLVVEETQQTLAAEDTYLTPIETQVYTGLLNQTWGINVRLEQERIPWSEAMTTLIAALFPTKHQQAAAKVDY